MFDRRINRLGFLLGHVYWLIIVLGLASLISLIEGPEGVSVDGVRKIIAVGLALVFLAVVIWGIPLSLSLVWRRLHDLGHEWYLALLYAVPVVSVGLYVYLLLKPGQSAPNKYGPPVRDNSVFVALGLAKPDQD